MMIVTEMDIRQKIVSCCRELIASGLTQGTSGNISSRFQNRMLISPSAVPYDELTPEMITTVSLDDPDGAWAGPLAPSSEWRFHQRLLRERPDIEAVVHAHPPHCTALAITRREIPACHYMVAAFGGANVRCAGYARYGTGELSDLVLEAMHARTACLLANHGMITTGETLDRALWRAVELEALAQQYILSLSAGDPVLLSDAEIAEVIEGFAEYRPTAADRAEG